MAKNKNLWSKLSNISAYVGGTALIIHTFFIKYIESYVEIILLLEAVSLVTFLIAEMMKYNIKNRNK